MCNTSQEIDQTFREDLPLSFGNISGISPIREPFDVFYSDSDNYNSVCEEEGEEVEVGSPAQWVE